MDFSLDKGRLSIEDMNFARVIGKWWVAFVDIAQLLWAVRSCAISKESMKIAL